MLLGHKPGRFALSLTCNYCTLYRLTLAVPTGLPRRHSFACFEFALKNGGWLYSLGMLRLFLEGIFPDVSRWYYALPLQAPPWSLQDVTCPGQR